jgi:hypothetical protein
MQNLSTVLLLGVLAGAGMAQAAAAGNDAANLCDGLFTGTSRVAVAAVSRPPFMKYYKDPAFGTRVIRITDAREGEVF